MSPSARGSFLFIGAEAHARSMTTSHESKTLVATLRGAVNEIAAAAPTLPSRWPIANRFALKGKLPAAAARPRWKIEKSSEYCKSVIDRLQVAARDAARPGRARRDLLRKSTTPDQVTERRMR
ncbi:hypothetical protein EVAR_32436_1 [Eumeta japonica]|uniref:Uncharacterized protein n=1 Tax=Eumeta variegata TaxID=151549 RepID=A0A4C1VNQ2_EUMVA|nr:hypothetical protein EVAR_32436_1 [Eumeta japonica]